MPVASVENGQYSLLMYVESSRRQGDWYRVTYARTLHTLGCDCAAWARKVQGHTDRSCKHTLFVNSLLRPATPAQFASNQRGGAAREAYQRPTDAFDDMTPDPGSDHPYISAIQTQFRGLHGTWQVEERRGYIVADGYRIVQITLQTGNGDLIQESVAFADAHPRSAQELTQEVAVRIGYAISLELAHRRNIAIPIRPPSHYSPQRSTTRTRQRAVPPYPTAGQETAAQLPSIRFDDILRVSGSPAAGNSPAERAEGTLRLLLGDELYASLAANGYLDVQSVQYADRKRVYRLRRDPEHRLDKRVRVFEQVNGVMSYVRDYCIVRADPNVPEGDGYISKWLGLLSDEGRCLSVVGSHNIFPPYSDDYGAHLHENQLPVWRQQATVD